jgi:hypothetical protein
MNSILLPADLYAKFFVVAESRTSAPPLPSVMPPAEARASTPIGATSRTAGSARAFWQSLGLLPLARFDLDL